MFCSVGGIDTTRTSSSKNRTISIRLVCRNSKTRTQLNGNLAERIKEFNRLFHFLLHSECLVDEGTNMENQIEQAKHEKIPIHKGDPELEEVYRI